MTPAEITGNILLFLLVFGMSATVDFTAMMRQLRNTRAISTGFFLQFVLLPFLGYVSVKVMDLDNVVGLTLLVVTSSPGGSFSNWWCSIFNADLALSVTMTAISTIVSTVMLPLNLLLYTNLAFGQDSETVMHMIDFRALFTSLCVVVSAVGLGVLATLKEDSYKFSVHANKFGSIAGLALVVLSAASANNKPSEQSLNSRDWRFYFGIALPCLLALIISNIITIYAGLKKPERVTSAIECCYQNTGIAASVALAMFEGDDLTLAMTVPFFYGVVEVVFIGIYCIAAWKIGWTKAPPNESLWRVITCSYEVIVSEQLEKNHTSIEVQLSSALNAELDVEKLTVDDTGSVEHSLYYCHKTRNLEDRLSANRGPKPDSDYDITLNNDYLKSLGYSVVEE